MCIRDRLYGDCEGYFHTDPESVSLYLNDIVEFFGNSLPLEVMLFISSDVPESDNNISHLISEVLYLTHVSIESSIIATTCWNDGNNQDELPGLEDEGQIPVAIPIELEIEVCVLKDESDYESLYDNTMELYDNFDPSKVIDMGGASASRCRVDTAIREGYKAHGLEITRPSKTHSCVKEKTGNYNSCKILQCTQLHVIISIYNSMFFT